MAVDAGHYLLYRVNEKIMKGNTVVTQHHFRHICVDAAEFQSVRTLDDFTKVSRRQSLRQTYYSSMPGDPDRGANKYHGDALESLIEVLFLDQGNHKTINVTLYRPATVDEFAFDGYARRNRGHNDFQTLGVQIKHTSDPGHWFDSNNSNILSAVAGLKADNIDQLLFVNTGQGIRRGLLERLNQRETIVRQLNRNELAILLDGNTAVWDVWRDSLTNVGSST